MLDKRKKLARTEIGKRIRTLRNQRKLSQTQVAGELCISQAAYSLIENSQNGVAAEHIIKLSELYDVPTDYILKGNEKLQQVSPSHGYVPFVNVKAQAGFIENSEKSVAYEDQDWFRLPGFNPVMDQKLFEVEGESMIPTVLPGDVVVCQLQKSIGNLISGSVVLVLTKRSIEIKRFVHFVGPDLLLESDNPEYEKKEQLIKREDVKQVFSVRGKLTSTLLPFHQITSQGKIQALEESLRRLQREVFDLQKKLVRQHQE